MLAPAPTIPSVNRCQISLGIAALLLAGCAAVAPVEELTWSSPLAKSLPLEQGAVVEAARFSELHAGQASLGDWEPFVMVRGNKPTAYQPVERDGVVVIQAESAEG